MSKSKTVDLLVADVRRDEPDRVEVYFAGDDGSDGQTWMTVVDGDLPRRPRVGDVLRVQVPKAVKIVTDGVERADGGVGLVYLCSPYSHADPMVRLRRFEAVCRAAADLMLKGILVFSPISHSHPIAGMMRRAGLFEPALDGELWRRQDAPYLEFCERMIVLCLPGWHRSVGVLGEIRAMSTAGKPVEYMRLVNGKVQIHPRARRLTAAEAEACVKLGGGGQAGPIEVNGDTE